MTLETEWVNLESEEPSLVQSGPVNALFRFPENKPVRSI